MCIHLGKNVLTNEEKEEAEDWVYEHHPEFLVYYHGFIQKNAEHFPKRVFEKEFIKQGEFTASKYWMYLEKKFKDYSKTPATKVEFLKFARRLLSCPPSAANLERVFSTFAHIWNKTRNRLGTEKAAKLVRLYRALRAADPGIDPHDWLMEDIPLD